MDLEITIEDKSTNAGEKTFYDTVHGYMDFKPHVVKIIDTVEFQRLRNIKQLGTACYVYPCAIHTRFEHCLGVAHLGRRLMSVLQTNQPELGITERDIKCVEIAGLCHDLGHGPFSHSFDHVILSSIPVEALDYQKWLEYGLDLKNHEHRSIWILWHMINKYSLDITAREFLAISRMISPEIKMSLLGLMVWTASEVLIVPESEWSKLPLINTPESFVYSIIANKQNNLDVDKMDYIIRDTRNLGHRYSFDYLGLFRHCRVIDNMICFSVKEAYSLHDLFRCRYRLHKKVFGHPVVKSLELSISEILKHTMQTFPGFQLRNCFSSPEKFCLHTDSILDVARFKVMSEIQALNESISRPECVSTPVLITLLDDFYQRKIRTYIHQIDVTSYEEEDIQELEKSIKEELKSKFGISTITTREKFGYTSQFDQPLKNIYFYDKYHPDKRVILTEKQISRFISDRTKELFLRFYTSTPCDKLSKTVKRQAYELVELHNQ